MATLQAALPAPYYIDEAHWRREREQVLHREWFCAGRLSELGLGPGSRQRLAVVDVAGESVLVTQDLEGGLHAFYNVCRHRGSQVVPVDPGPSRRPRAPPARCAARTTRGPTTSPGDCCGRRTPTRSTTSTRRPSGCTRWPPGRGAGSSSCTSPRRRRRRRCSSRWAPFAGRAAALPAGVAGGRAPPHLRRRAPTTRWSLENYNECYHCAGVHPELVRLVPAFGRGGGDLDWEAGIPHRDGRVDVHVVRDVDPRAVPRPGRRRAGAAQGRAALPEPDAQPVRRPRRGVHPAADRSRPHPDRVRPAVRAGRGRAGHLRPHRRRRVLGHRQPAGLGGLRVRAARHVVARATPRAGSRRWRTPAWTSAAGCCRGWSSRERAAPGGRVDTVVVGLGGLGSARRPGSSRAEAATSSASSSSSSGTRAAPRTTPRGSCAAATTRRPTSGWPARRTPTGPSWSAPAARTLVTTTGGVDLFPAGRGDPGDRLRGQHEGGRRAVRAARRGRDLGRAGRRCGCPRARSACTRPTRRSCRPAARRPRWPRLARGAGARLHDRSPVTSLTVEDDGASDGRRRRRRRSRVPGPPGRAHRRRLDQRRCSRTSAPRCR